MRLIKLILILVVFFPIINLYGEIDKILSYEHFSKGIKYYIARDYKNASKEWMKALNFDPTNRKIKSYFDVAQKKYYSSKLNFYKGIEFFKQGKYKKAIKKFKKALFINPRYKKAEYYLKLCYTPKMDIYTYGNIFSISYNNNIFVVKLDKSDTVDFWIKEWSIAIVNTNGRIIRFLKGKKDPATNIVWDMKDNKGNVSEDTKTAKYYLILKSIYNRNIFSKTNSITIDNTGPMIKVSANSNFYPDSQDKKNNRVVFKGIVKDNISGISNCRIDIYNSKKSNIIKEITLDKEKEKYEIVWDGNTVDGSKIPGGQTVYYRIVASDKAGNISKTEFKPIEARIFLKKEKRGLVMNLPNIEFDFGKARLKKSSFEVLYKAGSIIKKYIEEYKNAKFIIEGHTDNVGDAKQNLILSRKRAQAVFNYLKNKFFFNSEQFEVKGYGESKPLVPNTSEKNRAKNRRVEIIIKKNN